MSYASLIDVRVLREVEQLANKIANGYGALSDLLYFVYDLGRLYGYGEATRNINIMQYAGTLFNTIYVNATNIQVPHELQRLIAEQIAPYIG